MHQQTLQAGELPRTSFIKRGLILEYTTIVYNSLEGLIAIIFGLIAGSIALVGFGFDSVIEVSSGAILLWRLYADEEEERRERIELISFRAVGICFVLLALSVAYEAFSSLVRHASPERSIPGILLAGASLVVMPLLARAKRRVAMNIKSEAMRADAKQTEFCTYLSAILLCGLLLNALCSWWWADPVAALAMAPIIAKEGIEGLRGDPCCD